MLAWTIISVKSCAKCSRASPAACELQFVSESDHKYKYTLIHLFDIKIISLLLSPTSALCCWTILPASSLLRMSFWFHERCRCPSPTWTHGAAKSTPYSVWYTTWRWLQIKQRIYSLWYELDLRCVIVSSQKTQSNKKTWIISVLIIYFKKIRSTFRKID